jgi:hypothetical protein
MRCCSVCGVRAWHRIIVEPRMIPVCEDRHCRRFAAALPARYCHDRLDSGRLCGAEPGAFVHEEGQILCGWHMRQMLHAQASASSSHMLAKAG